MRVPTASVLLICALALTGCGSNTATQPTEEPEARATVPWDDYAPKMQELIDTASCEELDEHFSNAVTNNDHVASTTDHNNADLMEYIDEAGAIAGC